MTKKNVLYYLVKSQAAKPRQVHKMVFFLSSHNQDLLSTMIIYTLTEKEKCANP